MNAKRKIDLTNNLFNRERIGSILKNFREAKGLSQRELARALGYMNANFISMIETGRSAPPLGKLLELCEAIDADKAIIAVILKYLYPDAWDATLAAIYGCPGIFKSKSRKIDEDVEAKFLELIHDWCSI